MKNIIGKWIHLNGEVGDPWLLPIWAAVDKAVKSRRTKKLSQDIIEIGGHISIRLNMLPRIIQRINSEWNDLYEIIKNIDPKYEYSMNKNGYAFGIDNDLKNNIFIDIDALLFELHSCRNLIEKLFGALYKHVGVPLKKDHGLKEILEDAGLNIIWFEKLRTHRNFFIHLGAPYIAVNISNAQKYDLIIMKENLKSFDNPKKFLQLSEINSIVQGFRKSKNVIQNNLIELFKNL